MIAVGGVLALWSTTGAMTTYMTAINLAYGHKDGRSFVRKRFVAVQLVAVIGLAFLLVAVLLIFGPPLERLVASHAGGASGAVGWIWWIAEWPILLLGLLAAFATLLSSGRTWSSRAGVSSHRGRCWRCSSGSPPRGLRVLHVELRLLQQDVGIARGRDHHAHLAVARRGRAAARCRGQCRG